ncbi:DNA-3-methyladenine glycosylase I [Vagococcus elongatus]|uniref:DNA-3-methyladenine glycosylase n=1 Tax=Vagococcus elongatus TaxID=180344 RepID=A0A430AZR9_9ENTE|nr:DNA-3-methyladenine glycosylase I [Vagococcus elongatus]RSU13587.1 DNA-3-methyladenine glycosylase [Vagococcus elongatus]
MKKYDWYSQQWGQPTRDAQMLFLLLTVGVFQAGLSWKAAASKREVFLKHFCNMDYQKVAGFFEEDVDRIAEDPEMIRNKRKIRAVIQNARAIVMLEKEGVSFADYLWDFVGDVALVKHYETLDDISNTLPEGRRIAKDMKNRGFTFVGPVVTTIFLKAAGIVQDAIWSE